MDSAALITVSTRNATNVGVGAWQFNFGANNVYVKNITSAEVLQITVPNVFDNVNQYYNTLRVSNTTTPGVFTDIVIPVGTYTAEDLVTAVNSALVTAGVTTLTLSYAAVVGSSLDFRYSWTSTRVDPAADHVQLDQSLHSIIGLPPDGTALDGDTSYTINTATSPFQLNKPNLQVAVRQVHILSEKLGHSTCVHSKTPISPLDLVATIPLTVAFGGYEQWQPADRSDFRNGNLASVHIDTLKFCLLDQDLNPLPLPDNYDIEMIWRIRHKDGKGHVPTVTRD